MRGKCFYETFVLKQTVLHLLNINIIDSSLRQYPKRSATHKTKKPALLCVKEGGGLFGSPKPGMSSLKNKPGTRYKTEIKPATRKLPVGFFWFIS